MHGVDDLSPVPPGAASPREALESAIRPALRSGSCHVMFSGGRDSSVVLAVATTLARREGLDPPVPVTRVYPRIAESDERTWQELVVRHLGLSDWLRWEFDHQHDLLGPEATASLRRHGLLWPAALHVQRSLYQRIGSGHVLSGEGGDEVLAGRRINALHRLARRRLPSRSDLANAARAVQPRPARERRCRRALRTIDPMPWVRPSAWEQHLMLLARDDAMAPLRWDHATWNLGGRRVWQVMQANDAVVAEEAGVVSRHPLLDAQFLAALARAGGAWGWPGRTSVMMALFDDVLPESLLRRSTKASFNHAYRGPGTIAFAREWDGTGVDPSLVDPDALRDQWLGDQPTFSAAVLLHQAWLASSRADTTAPLDDVASTAPSA